MLTLIALLAAAYTPCPPRDEAIIPVLYRVFGPGRLPLYRTADCDSASCHERAYVVPGDSVVGYSEQGGRTCIFIDVTVPRGGWVDTERLARDVAAAHPPLSDWAGNWHDGDDHIRLTVTRSGRLRVDGGAYYPSRHPSPDNPGGPHFGQLGGYAVVDSNKAVYRDGEGDGVCRVTMRLLGRYLVVGDNEQCGGQNVRFRGVYRRR